MSQNLVFEYFPTNMAAVARIYLNNNSMPTDMIKVYCYQALRAIAYCHGKGLIHSDIKPDNFLINNETHALKLCDFGSTRLISNKKAMVSYIGTRHFRPPELILNSTALTYSIDIWAAGCSFAAFYRGGRSLFSGASQWEALVEIIKVMGVPTQEQLEKMKANITNPTYNLSSIPKSRSWADKLLGKPDPLFVDLLTKLMKYVPEERLYALQALAHPFFDELRQENFTTVYPQYSSLDFFDLTEDELRLGPTFERVLVPHWYRQRQAKYHSEF